MNRSILVLTLSLSLTACLKEPAERDSYGPYACWDADEDNLRDNDEDENNDGFVDSLDCYHETADMGQSCWDLNGNGIGDFPDEDPNGDGTVDVLDCHGDLTQDLLARIEELEDYNAELMAVMTISSDSVVFSGVNVYVQNGEGATDTVNGLGNLIVGYDEDYEGDEKFGSHNIVVGIGHTYTSYSGLLAGFNNFSLAEYTTVLGGHNQATATMATVTGGSGNVAAAKLSSIPGGAANRTSGNYSLALGGSYNTASGIRAVAMGGFENTASGEQSVTVAGEENTASGLRSLSAGGAGNTASGELATTIGE